MLTDQSNGYEIVAEEFIRRRTISTVGVTTVSEWAKQFPRGAHVLDLGCGHGVPISQALVTAGLVVHGVDASAAMVAAFRARLPEASAEHVAVEDFEFPVAAFDGAVAWGLMFLLAPGVQAAVIQKVARTLKRGGRFVFTSPWQVCEWRDLLTGRVSRSPGREAYRRMLRAAGLTDEGEHDDEGDNHYFFAVKP